MTTLELAERLNAIYTIYPARMGDKRRKQPFKYLLVLDFEATCWEKHAHNKGQSEIIEFPCVLFDTTLGQIVEEFQRYVRPTERPRLTDFCTELTGIQQSQVDDGILLMECLNEFEKWLSNIACKYNISIGNINETETNKCIFATWSDWDLGKCLLKECKRKGLVKNGIFNKWIDVRLLFVEHYGLKPKGLDGALNSVGLTFEGRQHCGLQDSRNTAKLMKKMIDDGVVFYMTKNIS